MLLTCSGPLTLLALCLHPAIATAREPGLDEVVAQINAAIDNLSDVSCTMIEEFDPAWAPAETTRIRLAVPDRVRATTTDEYGNERIAIKNGNVEWRVQNPMSVSKTVWADGGPKHSFEWNDHAMFRIPGNHWVEYANMGGDVPVRLLHINNLPVAMSTLQSPDHFFDTSVPTKADLIGGPEGEFFSDAQAVENDPSGRGQVANYWVGNFFPDMRAWDRLVPFKGRGAGGTTVFVQYPGSELTAHMSVFPAKTYKKGHRHGPAYIIVIPAGEGFSVMWPEGQEKVFIPWHEGSIFVPPNRWFHQHFNVGEQAGRYLAFHPLPQFTGFMGEKIDRSADQYEYHQEAPEIRERFEAELAKRNLTSEMPPDCYTDANYQFANEK